MSHFGCSCVLSSGEWSPRTRFRDPRSTTRMDTYSPMIGSRDVDVEIGRAWRDHRRHLLDIAFNMLGNLSEAEDVVQEAFTRLVKQDVDRIDNIGGWLVVVVSRLCVDKLRDRRRHPTASDESVGDRRADPALDP